MNLEIRGAFIVTPQDNGTKVERKHFLSKTEKSISINPLMSRIESSMQLTKSYSPD